MKSRKNNIINIPLKAKTSSTSLTAGKQVFLEVSTGFNDGQMTSARGPCPSKHYSLNAQVVLAEVCDGRTWHSMVGGWGAKLKLRDATRFNQNTLLKLPVSNEGVLNVVQSAMKASGLSLSEAGVTLLREYLLENNVSLPEEAEERRQAALLIHCHVA
jgi:hypothetical protein